MAGGYITCGDFEGDDKSGSALLGVIADLQALLRWESEPELNALLSKMHSFVSGEGEQPAEWDEGIELSAIEIKSLAPYLKKCRELLISQVGPDDSDLNKAMDEESKTSDAKWGGGAGWRLYCCNDLLTAAMHSTATQESVHITFD